MLSWICLDSNKYRDSSAGIKMNQILSQHCLGFQDLCVQIHTNTGAHAHTHCYTGARMLTPAIQASLPPSSLFALCLSFPPSLEKKAKCCIWARGRQRTYIFLVSCLVSETQLSCLVPQELLQTVSLCASNKYFWNTFKLDISVFEIPQILPLYTSIAVMRERGRERGREKERVRWCTHIVVSTQS